MRRRFFEVPLSVTLAALVLAVCATCLSAGRVEAQEVETAPGMTVDRMGEILAAVDPEVQRLGNSYQLNIEGVPVFVVSDPLHDRMRAMTPIRSAEAIAPEEINRMMQANFDSALDARYAFAQGMLWSAFIHPLSPLEKDELLSGLGQVVNLALTYGTSYTSGAITFRGGDSNEIERRRLIDDLLKKGEEI